MDDSICKPRTDLEMDFLHPRDHGVHHYPRGYSGPLGAEVCAGEEAGEEKWEEDLLHTCEFSEEEGNGQF